MRDSSRSNSGGAHSFYPTEYNGVGSRAVRNDELETTLGFGPRHPLLVLAWGARALDPLTIVFLQRRLGVLSKEMEESEPLSQEMRTGVWWPHHARRLSEAVNGATASIRQGWSVWADVGLHP